MALSPMMKHYLSVKDKHKDCIVFYRLGDFYEMFFDDAVKVSNLLDLTLTGRDCGLEKRAPMCGIPFHAADIYIAKLVSLGEKVAICEQLTEPNGKELVERDVIKIVTAGTITNNELIDEKSNNFLGAVYINNSVASFAYTDITTGEFFVKKFDSINFLEELSDSLVKINPVEIISNKQAYEIFSASPLTERGVISKFQQYLESAFNIINATKIICEQLSISDLSSTSINDEDVCISSSGALISYINETQKKALTNIKQISYISDNDTVMLDISAIRNLELIKTIKDSKRYGSLLWLLDKTKTSMGARKLQSWILSPLRNIEKINSRLDAVESFYSNTLVRQSLIDLLSQVKDIGRITGKISNGNLMPKDCLALAYSLEVLPSVKFHLAGLNSQFILNIFSKLGDFEDIVKLLKSAFMEDLPSNMKDGGYIKDGFNAELDDLRNTSKNAKSLIAEMENNEREKTGIKTLKIGYNRVFGYYIELTNSVKNMAPYNYIRRQTIANAERFITDELKELENKILNSQELALKLEGELYVKIKQTLENRIKDLMQTSDAISDLDVILSLATIARENNYVKPILTDNGSLEIIGGRHPVVESVSKQKFIPNDAILDEKENRTIILTGPNMAGKSTYMRQIALITIMAHIGSFVPASSAIIPLTDKIFTRIGASDSLISDQSTFMVEMNETATILNNATKDSLIILDEIGRGTSTFDGLSIAWAVVEHINNKIKAKTLFATHYHELTDLEGKLEGIKNYKVTVKELQGEIVFMRKIMRGGANKSFGIEVAKLAGINTEVTDRAKTLLKVIEKNDISLENDDKDEEVPQKLTRVEQAIKQIDINNLTPIQAFNILTELSDMVKDL